MKLKIVFNSNSIDDEKYSIGWGLSVLIDNSVLFDTGEKGNYLLNNISALDIDTTKIDNIVISHDHWDHTGGLWDLLKEHSNATVFACPDFSAKFHKKVVSYKSTLINLEEPRKIDDNIYSTGQISGSYKGQFMPEQAIVIKTNRGISLITGCAHPGILKILVHAKNMFPDDDIYMVMGGFHLMNEDMRKINFIIKSFKEMGVKKVGPTHCTGNEAENLFLDAYKDNFASLPAGTIVEV